VFYAKNVKGILSFITSLGTSSRRQAVTITQPV